MSREIIVNGRFLSRRVTGVERYGREILAIIGKECQVETTQRNGFAGHVWEQCILPVTLKRGAMLWSPANTGPLFVRNQALTIHDLSPLEHPEWFQRGFAIWYRLLLPLLVKRVCVIFTPSEYVKRNIAARFGVENVVVTPNGVDTAFFHPQAKQSAIEFPGKYILFVGSIQPRKNLEQLLRAWHVIKDEFKDTWLVVAGAAGHVFRAIKFFGDDRVRFLNYVPEPDLPGLYANAEVFVLPSLDEGFGLPVLEAMACGVPVLASNGGALPEVVGDAGMVFDLSKPDDLSGSLQNILNNRGLSMQLRERGLVRAESFSWQKTAGLIWSSLNS